MTEELWVMFADEADQDGSKQYLVSAGVFFSAYSIPKIHVEIQRLWQKLGFKDGDDLKFSVTTKPKDVTPENHTAIKQAALELAAQHGCKVCLYLTPHSIAKGKSKEERLKYATNTLINQFNLFLGTSRVGLAYFDRLSEFNQFDYYKEIFQLGLEFKGTRRKMSRIAAIAPTSNNASHLSSVTDIVTGSFRWVVNEPDKDKVGRILWRSLSQLMWYETDHFGVPIVRDRGFCLRPKTRAVEAYEADVRETISRLNRYLETP